MKFVLIDRPVLVEDDAKIIDTVSTIARDIPHFEALSEHVQEMLGANAGISCRSLFEGSCIGRCFIIVIYDEVYASKRIAGLWMSDDYQGRFKTTKDLYRIGSERLSSSEAIQYGAVISVLTMLVLAFSSLVMWWPLAFVGVGLGIFTKWYRRRSLFKHFNLTL